MARVKRGTTSRARHNRLQRMAKGYYGRSKNTVRQTHQAVERALKFSYRDRRRRRRDMRSLWILRINAAARMRGITYSQLINDLKKKGIAINRKILAELAARAPERFDDILQ